MKFIIVLIIVAVVLVGLLLTLRTSRNAGMPGEDVIKRAQERSRAQNSNDDDD
jgi:hypothetical protein